MSQDPTHDDQIVDQQHDDINLDDIDDEKRDIDDFSYTIPSFSYDTSIPTTPSDEENPLPIIERRNRKLKKNKSNKLKKN